QGTEIVVSRLSFGTARLHRVLSANRRQWLLAAAFDAGVTHFDTAPLYGFGLAECDLGRFVKTHRGNVTVTTKIGLYPRYVGSTASSALGAKVLSKLWPHSHAPRADWTLTTIATEFQASLRRLQTETVDLLLLHEPSVRLFQPEALLGWLKTERDKGRIRAWGLAGETAPVCECLTDEDELGMVLQ